MKLSDLNALGEQEATELFFQCCASDAWVSRMLETLPYASREILLDTARSSWLGLSEQDYLQAFDGHPRIGDVQSLKEKYKNTQHVASHEQAGVKGAGEEIILELADLNTRYENKFGFIFIVCASGKSAAQMLALLKSRLYNNRNDELVNAIEEQKKIFCLRLEKML